MYAGAQYNRGQRAPLTFWDLLNESYSQIAHKCNKKLNEIKYLPLTNPWLSPQPPHFSDGCVAPVRMYITIDFRSELSRSSVFIPSNLSGFFVQSFCFTIDEVAKQIVFQNFFAYHLSQNMSRQNTFVKRAKNKLAWNCYEKIVLLAI